MYLYLTVLQDIYYFLWEALERTSCCAFLGFWYNAQLLAHFGSCVVFVGLRGHAQRAGEASMRCNAFTYRVFSCIVALDTFFLGDMIFLDEPLRKVLFSQITV